MFHAGWMAVTGDNMTYNWHSMLVGNYGSTLLNTSFGFPTYIRHSSSKSLFENLKDDEVTLGVAFSDRRGHQKETVPTTQLFKKILDLAYFDQAAMTEEIVAPGCNVTMKTMKALYEPIYIYMPCETAKSVMIKWFALTDNYHIVKASVSVLMEDDDLPVLPCMLRNSKCYAGRPDCMASLEQAEMFFSSDLDYHLARYEVLYKTVDVTAFCKAWDTATEGVGYGNCTLSFGPTGAEYNDWKLSSSMFNITHEFAPKDKPDEENPMIGFRGCGRNTDPFFEERLAMELEAVKMVRREMGRKNVENMIRVVRTPDMAKDITEVLENNGPKGERIVRYNLQK